MKDSGGKILVGTLGERVYVQVEGKGTHLVSQPLREFLFEMIGSGYRSFDLDLGNCTYMDSTFLGMLVGVSLRLRTVTHARLGLRRVNARNLELFRTLGIEQFFEINLEPKTETPADSGTLRPLSDATGSKLERAETMLEAHQTLANVNEENVPRFKDCIEFLKEDLARIKSTRQSKPDSIDKP